MAEEDFADASQESVLARWGSLTAPLCPSVLLSKEASSTLFSTPWRGGDSIVLRSRYIVQHVINVFEGDLNCQASWAIACWNGVRSCMHLTACELLCWTYTACLIMATLLGGASLSATVGLGTATKHLYLLGSARAFVSFVYEAVCLLQSGPSLRAKALVRSRAREFVLSAVASMMLPSDILASHLALCCLFGFMEKLLRLLFSLALPSLQAASRVRDIVSSEVERTVGLVLQNFQKENSPPRLRRFE